MLKSASSQIHQYGFPLGKQPLPVFFLHNEIQVTVTDINAIGKLNPLGHILYLLDFRNI